MLPPSLQKTPLGMSKKIMRKWNLMEMHQLLVYTDVNILGENESLKVVTNNIAL